MFSPGQLIWAKMWGYPPWPARVSSLKSKQTFLRRLALWNSTLSFAVFLSPFRLIFLQICLKNQVASRGQSLNSEEMRSEKCYLTQEI